MYGVELCSSSAFDLEAAARHTRGRGARACPLRTHVHSCTQDVHMCVHVCARIRTHVQAAAALANLARESEDNRNSIVDANGILSVTAVDKACMHDAYMHGHAYMCIRHPLCDGCRQGMHA